MKKFWFVILLILSLCLTAGDKLPATRGYMSQYGYAPPGSDDVTFVAKEGGDLGFLHYQSDGPICFNLLVDRYFGNEQERQKQIALGLIPSELDLYMPSVDVDVGYGEVDKVYFNNHEIGMLWGDNAMISMNHFSIPVKYVNFPESEGGVGVNKIKIVVDVLNDKDVWYTSIPWATLLIPAPRPVVMVHGWQGSPDLWDQMRQELSNNIGIPSLAVEVEKNDSVSTNGIILWNFLREMREEWKVQELNIIAHSKGGLDSRHLTHPHGEDDERIPFVEQIATPNAGSNLAFLVGHRDYFSKDLEYLTALLSLAWDFDRVGLLSLLPEACRSFNKMFPVATSNAKVNVITGRVPNPDDSYWGPKGHYLQKIAWYSYCHDDYSGDERRWGDCIVSVKSAHTEANPVGASPLHHRDAWHCDIPSKMASACLVAFRGDLMEVKSPTYSGPGSDQNTRSLPWEVPPRPLRPLPGIAAADEPLDCQDEGLAWEASGFVKAGQVECQSFDNLVSQTLSLHFLGLSREVTVTLKFPDGQVINSQDDADKFRFLTAEETENDLFIGLFQGVSWEGEAPSGHYEFRLDGRNLQNDLPYRFLQLSKISPATLKIAVTPEFGSCNTPFTLSAQVVGVEDNQPLLETGATLTVFRQDAEKDTLAGRFDFHDDGVAPDLLANDGVFACEFVPPRPGRYNLAVTSETRLPSGLMARRQAEQSISVTETAARILEELEEQPCDTNWDGAYETLDFHVTIEASKPATCTLSGELQAQDGQLIGVASCHRFALASGSNLVTLSFNGRKIFEAGHDGPFYLTRLMLTAQGEDDVQPLHFLDWKFETAEYSHWQFDHPAYRLVRNGDGSDTGSDIGIDTDNDVRIDIIRYSFSVEVAPDAPRNCHWRANLEDRATGRQIMTVQQQGEVIPNADNRATLTLDFPCADMQNAKLPETSFVIAGLMLGPVDGNMTHLPCRHQTNIYCFTLAGTLFPGNVQQIGIQGIMRLLEGELPELNPFHLLVNVRADDCFSATDEFILTLTLPEGSQFRSAEWNALPVEWYQDENNVTLILTGHVPGQNAELYCEFTLDDVFPRDDLYFSGTIEYADQDFQLRGNHQLKYNCEVQRALNLEAGHWYALTLDGLPTRYSALQLLDQRPFLYAPGHTAWVFANKKDLRPGTSLVFYAQADDELWLDRNVSEEYLEQGRTLTSVWDFGQGQKPPLFQLDSETGRFTHVSTPERDYSSTLMLLNYPTWTLE